MNKSNELLSKYIVVLLIPLLFILILMVTYRIYEGRFGNHITVKFAHSGPLYKNMPVYFRGYKIGQSLDVKPSEDYKHTLVKVWLYPRNPKLPEDVTAKVKKLNPNENYIDLINFDETLTEVLKNGSTIDGEPAFDLDAFLSDIDDSGVLIPLLQNFSDVLVSANKTSEEIRNFFSDSRLVVNDNRQSLKEASQNFNQTSKSLKKLTSKFNNSITEDKLNNTTSGVDKSVTNIQAASESIKNITSSVDCATRNLSQTVVNLDSALCETKAVATNAKAITGGLRETLGKRFAGLRLIFGQPLKEKSCKTRCNR